MRLTLHTLLAYLDGELPLDRARQIEAKIADSRIATELAERIRAVRTRLRLSAPALDATGDADANVAAEYLDSQLPPEQEAEFELQCLKSDERLAEVANCHHLLGIILRKPAEVRADLRSRVYQLPASDPGQAALRGTGATSQSDIAAPSPTPRSVVMPVSLPPEDSEPSARGVQYPSQLRKERSEAERRALRPEIPDYLRAGRPARMAPWLTTLLMLAIFLLVLANTLRPLWQKPSSATATSESASGTVARGSSATPAVRPLPRTDESSTLSSATSDAAALDTEPQTPESGQASLAKETKPESGDASSTTSEAATSEMTETTDESAEAEEPAETPDSAAQAPATSTDETTNPETTTPAPEEPTTEATPASASQAQLTRVAGLLLTMDTASGNWFARNPEMALEGETEYASAPLSRSVFTLPGNLRVELIGAARGFIRPLGNGAWEFELSHGRAGVYGPAESVRVPMRLGAISGTLELGPGESKVALEVQARRAPGADPSDPASQHTIHELICTQGSAQWQGSEANEAIILNLLEQNSWLDGVASPAVVQEKPPVWLLTSSQSDSALERMAINELRARIVSDRPAELTLRETLNFRRPEVVALAARTLLELGNADIYFGSDGVLNNPEQRSAWPEHFTDLQAKISRSPEAAAAVETAAKQADANGSLMYRLLWGFSEQELENGVDAKLVEWLDHPTMAVRVLAFENLRAITGLDLNYRADYETSARRRDAIKKWEARQRKGDIRYPSE